MRLDANDGLSIFREHAAYSDLCVVLVDVHVQLLAINLTQPISIQMETYLLKSMSPALDGVVSVVGLNVACLLPQMIVSEGLLRVVVGKSTIAQVVVRSHQSLQLLFCQLISIGSLQEPYT